MRKIEPEIITGMGYIGDNPGVLYRMGGAGEQTVVTGNPALLDGVKGSRITSLTLHGKSTQGSTTGAQLISLNDSYGVTTVNGVTKTPIGISAWKLEGISKEDTIFYPYSSLAFLSLSKGDYVFSVFGTSKAKARYTIIGGGSSGYIQAGYSQKISIQEDVKLTFNFMIENGVEPNGILMIMLNSGSTSLPWEPYTGGAPSPSPSYPQEIESAGQSGEIGVTVTGANLLPFEVGQKGDGFEIFADGVQVDVGRNVDIYAVGVNDSLIESGYSEFPLLAPGKYYIYSDIQGVNLYAVAWRKGANVTLGYSSGGVAKEIEVMAGDKFRIFLRTAAAFKGKVKAMITRTPMNATSYEPYKPAQKLVIPTPGGLPGIPVSSGGNYTDKDGQQWVADEIVEKDGVLGIEKRIDREVLADVVFAKMETEMDKYFVARDVLTKAFRTDKALSNIARYSQYSIVPNNSYSYFTIVNNSVRVLPHLELFEELDEKTFNALINKQPLVIYGILKNSVFEPLPPETIAAYKKLHTYSPTTTVINDAGAGMSVGYKIK